MFRFDVERNPHGKGWYLRWRFGSNRKWRMGAGYRAWDLPWYSPSKDALWWRRKAYIGGRTLKMGWRVRVRPTGAPSYKALFRMTGFTRNANKARFYPGWW